MDYPLLPLSNAPGAVSNPCSVMPEESGPGALTGTVAVKRSAERVPAYIAPGHRLRLRLVTVLWRTSAQSLQALRKFSYQNSTQEQSYYTCFVNDKTQGEQLGGTH